jgi:hypothetical protein
VKVLRERVLDMLNVEDDASDAPKNVAILAISHPCSMPDQGSLALAAIPGLSHVSPLPHTGICSTHALPCAGA